jgi:ABC-type transport system involved in cytochrome c biogenesis ATPase subunit
MRLGTWSLTEGEPMLLTGGSQDLLVRAFLGLEEDAQITVLGAKAGSREARSVLALAFEGFIPMPSLKVLEHLALAVRIGPPRLGRVPSFREVLEEVGLLSSANKSAGDLDADGRFQLSLAMMLVRLLPVWVVAPPISYRASAGVVERLKQALDVGVAIVFLSDSELGQTLARQSRRLDVRVTHD